MKKRKNKRWKPKKNGYYWTIFEPLNYLFVGEDCNNEYRIDVKAIKMGNCFRTKKHAEVVRRKILKVLKEG